MTWEKKIPQGISVGQVSGIENHVMPYFVSVQMQDLSKSSALVQTFIEARNRSQHLMGFQCRLRPNKKNMCV